MLIATSSTVQKSLLKPGTLTTSLRELLKASFTSVKCGSKIQSLNSAPAEQDLAESRKEEAALAAYRQQLDGECWPIEVSNFPRTALRADILQCFVPELQLDAKKVWPAYDSTWRSMKYWLQLSSEKEQQIALSKNHSAMGLRKISLRAGTAEEMRAALQHPDISQSQGRYVIMSGMPRGCNLSQAMALFSQYDMESNPIKFLKMGCLHNKKPSAPVPNPVCLLRFQSSAEAHKAIRECNNSFIGDQIISLRVLP